MKPVHLLYLGNAADYHVDKWLPALCDVGLSVSLASFSVPRSHSPDIDYHHLTAKGPGAGRRKNLHPSDFIAGTRSVKRLIRRINPDVVMASFASTYGLMAVRTGFHPLMIQTWTRDVTVVPWAGWKRIYYRPVVSHVLRRADAIITDGPAHAQFVRDRFSVGCEKVFPAVWGVQLPTYARKNAKEARSFLELPPNAPVITSPRGVRSWYRPEVALTALSGLLERRQDAYVVVLTLEHERTDDVRRALDALTAHPRARVVDRFLSPEEMRNVWTASDVVVSIPQFDGVSESLLECMLADCVPVVADIESNRLLFAEPPEAIFVDGSDAEQLLDRLEATVDDLTVTKDRLCDTNRDWVAENGSVEATASKVANIVVSLAAAHAQKPPP